MLLNPMNLDDYQEKYKQAKIAYLERKLLELKREVAYYYFTKLKQIEKQLLEISKRTILV